MFMRVRKSTTSALIALLMLLWVIPAAAVTTLTSGDITTLYNQYFNATAFNHVSVHDPSVVIGYESGGNITGEYTAGATKVYYIFGSHLAWAYSSDLENWSTFTNNINTSYATLFAAPAAWSAKGTSSTYDVSGNMWAPDVVWNKQLQKWCMYMSINGDNWCSSIVMLTATTLNGDWTYEGPVVYSGFTSQTQAEATDFYSVIDKTTEGFPSRYTLNRNGNHTYGLNAIDPCVFYDADGNLWMTYGSWFGGIYMLRLDGKTGLRDYTYAYATTDGTAADATSDAYQGLKVAGGNHVSGEASYIENINGTYYLFVTNGGLTSTGGYNMRVYSSSAVTGPYVDMTGQDARYSSSNTGVGTINGVVGLRLMSYYKWSWMDKGYTAQGHNSAVVDDDGKSFLVYHTRFDDGSEGHQVRVHQLFQTKNGYVTAAPFQYAGETLASAAYATSDVAGSYSILYHGTGTDYANRVCVEEKEIQLNEDGSVTGTYTGTWSETSDGPYITLTINGVTFQGVLVTQKMEGLNYSTLCFSAVGNDISVWGYKKAGSGKPFPDDATVAYNANNLNGTVPSSAYSGSQISLPSTGYFGATYTWSWDANLIGSDGTVKTLAANTTTTLTLTITCGDYTYTTTYNIDLVAKSIADMIPISAAATLGTYADKTAFAAATPFSSKININTGLSLSFYCENITSDWTHIAQSSDAVFYLNLSTLDYNGAGFFEGTATLSSAAIAAGYDSGSAWTMFLNTKCYVTVSYNPDGSISYYKDGVLMLTFPASLSPTSFGSGITPSDIVRNVITYYRNGQLVFNTDVKNIVVGYSANLDLSTYTPLDISKYAYYQDYDNYGAISAWTSNGTISNVYDASLSSNYIRTSVPSGVAGNRSSTCTFSGVSTLTSYNFSIDACLTQGNTNNRSVSEVALISTDNAYTANSSTSITSTGYIFTLTTPTYTSSPNNGSIWYVNGNSSSALTIAPGTWVTIRGTVDVNAKTATVTIVNRTTKSTIYSKTTAVVGNGLLKGLWVLAGRGTGTMSVDNIKVFVDTTAPVIPTLGDITAECSATVTAPTTTDDFAGTIIGTTTQALPITTQGTTDVTWTFNDGNGHSVNAIQKVIIKDVTAPVIPTLADVTAECSVESLTAPTTTDNCAGTITGTTTQTFPITKQGTTEVTWTFDDGNENKTTAVQKVIIKDVTAPEVPTLADVTAECSVESLTAPTTTDNCAGTVTGTTTQTFPITAKGTTEVTWTFEDGNGHSVSAIQKVIIKDVTAPAIPILDDVTAECSVESLTAPTTTDNCAGIVTGITTQTFPITAKGTTEVTWTFDDGNENITTAIQKVIIKDITAPEVPTLADVTAEYSVESLTAPTTTDNCAGTIIGTTTQTFPITAKGTTNVIWTFDDGNENSIEVIQKVIIGQATDISDVASKSISIYPNPTSGIINFDFSTLDVKKVSISDITGKVIMEKLVSNQRESIDISNYSSGVYVINIQLEKEVITKKIMKK